MPAARCTITWEADPGADGRPFGHMQDIPLAALADAVRGIAADVAERIVVQPGAPAHVWLVARVYMPAPAPSTRICDLPAFYGLTDPPTTLEPTALELRERLRGHAPDNGGPR